MTTRGTTLSIAATQLALGVSRSTVMRLLNSGDLTSTRIGRRRLIHTESVEHILRHGVARVRRSA